MKQNKWCQSCGMPMSKDPKQGGTETNGSKSTAYCSYCYQDGAFTASHITTAKEMQIFCMTLMKKQEMQSIVAWLFTRSIPKLKRWNPSTITTIFFDFDGVLTLEESGSMATAKYLSKKTGITVKAIHDAYVQVFVGRDTTPGIISKKGWEDVCSILGTTIPYEELEYGMGHPPANEPMLEIVRSLRPTYHVGLITDNPVERVALLTDTFDLPNLFHSTTVFESMTVSGEEGVTKSDARIFEAALQHQKVAAEACIFVDNRQSNLDTAAALGMQTILYRHDVETMENFIQELQSKHINIS